MNFVRIFLTLALIPMLFAPARAADSSTVESGMRSFLTAYAAGDDRAVLAIVDDRVSVYGSDIAEIAIGKHALATLLKADHRLWGGAVTIGPMRDVSVVRGSGSTSLIFDAPFRTGQAPAVMVRFFMVWRHDLAGWRLVQAASSVPPRGQSAAALLRR